MLLMAVDISLVACKDSQPVLTLISEAFSRYSPLHKSQNISPPDYRRYLEDIWRDYIFSSKNISIVAHDNESGSLEGCLIAMPFGDESIDIRELPQNQQPIASLLHKLEQMYSVPDGYDISDVLLVDLAVVRRNSRRRGIYGKMRAEVHRIAKLRGYRFVVGALSSAETQSFCIDKMHQRVVAQIPYASFSYKNTYPFESIKKPVSIVLVEHCLED